MLSEAGSPPKNLAFLEITPYFLQMFLMIKFRSSMEFLYVFVRALVMIGVVTLVPEMAVVGFCLATVVVVIIQVWSL